MSNDDARRFRSQSGIANRSGSGKATTARTGLVLVIAPTLWETDRSSPPSHDGFSRRDHNNTLQGAIS